MRPRPRIRHYVPRWSGPIEGYTINTLLRYYPSLSAEYEFEDLLQEAYIKYLSCVRCYSGKLTSAAWFMALYKRALTNHLHTLRERSLRYSLVEYTEEHERSTDGGDAGEFAQLLERRLAALPPRLLRVVPRLVNGMSVSFKRVREFRAFLLQEK